MLPTRRIDPPLPRTLDTRPLLTLLTAAVVVSLSSARGASLELASYALLGMVLIDVREGDIAIAEEVRRMDCCRACTFAHHHAFMSNKHIEYTHMCTSAAYIHYRVWLSLHGGTAVGKLKFVSFKTCAYLPTEGVVG